MKKHLIITKIFLSIVLVSLLTVQFSFNYPDDYFTTLTSVILIKNEDPNDSISNIDYLTKLSEIAEKNNLELIAKSYSSENEKRMVNFYSSGDINIKYPNFFSKSTNNDLTELNDYNLDSKEFFLKGSTDNIEIFLQDILKEGFLFENLSYENDINRTYENIYIFIVILITDMIILYFFLIDTRKRDSLLSLNGYSRENIFLEKIFLIIKYNSIALAVPIFLLFSYLIITNTLNILLIKEIIITIITALIFNFITLILFEKYNRLNVIESIKNNYLSKKNYSIAVMLKIVFCILLIIVSIFASVNSYYIKDTIEGIEKYETFNNLYVSEISTSDEEQGLLSDPNSLISRIESSLLEFYNLTNSKYNGVLNHYYENEGLIINVNYFSYFDIYKEDGSLLSKEDFSNDTITYLIPESKKNSYNITFDYGAPYEIIFIKDDQIFKSLNTDNISTIIEIKNEVVQVYPEKIGSELTNLVSIISNNGYYLYIEGEDVYNVILDDLKESGADEFILDLYHVTNKYEERKFLLTGEYIKLFITLGIFYISYIYFSIYVIKNYLKLYSKNISISYLEGYKEAKIFRLIIMLSLITASLIIVSIILSPINLLISTILILLVILECIYIKFSIINFRKKALILSLKGGR